LKIGRNSYCGWNDEVKEELLKWNNEMQSDGDGRMTVIMGKGKMSQHLLQNSYDSWRAKWSITCGVYCW
jgi:hypothetical protein